MQRRNCLLMYCALSSLFTVSLMDNAGGLPCGRCSNRRGFLRCLRCGSYGIIRNFSTDNTDQTTVQKAGGTRSITAACVAGSSVSKVSDNFSGCTGSQGNSLECNHYVTKHGTASVSYIDADTCHETVDFLRDFEKANRTEKPDQYISRHGLAAGTADCGFDITFLQSNCGYSQSEHEQKNGAQQRNDSMIFLRGNDLLHGKRI